MDMTAEIVVNMPMSLLVMLNTQRTALIGQRRMLTMAPMTTPD